MAAALLGVFAVYPPCMICFGRTCPAAAAFPSHNFYIVFLRHSSAQYQPTLAGQRIANLAASADSCTWRDLSQLFPWPQDLLASNGALIATPLPVQELLISPTQLAALGVPVRRLVQYPGEFVINYPGEQFDWLLLHSVALPVTGNAKGQEFGPPPP